MSAKVIELHSSQPNATAAREAARMEDASLAVLLRQQRDDLHSTAEAPQITPRFHTSYAITIRHASDLERKLLHRGDEDMLVMTVNAATLEPNGAVMQATTRHALRPLSQVVAEELVREPAGLFYALRLMEVLGEAPDDATLEAFRIGEARRNAELSEPHNDLPESLQRAHAQALAAADDELAEGASADAPSEER